jgi:oligopeptide/dipeptide ABC transporter ATP-binding protein
LQVTFPVGRQGLVAVEDVGFEVGPGECLGLVGESGCGKTTVARCIVGLQRPDAGVVRLGGIVLGERRTKAERRAVQLVFQDPYSSLNPRMRTGPMLTELLHVHGIARGAQAAARAAELMGLVGLPVDALERFPTAFSGGQRQRVAIARALAVEPSVLVADEPISGLDVSVQATVLALFADLRDRLGISIVMISHNLVAVRQVCDRVAVMYLGRTVEVGPTGEIFGDPRHPYTQALLSAVPRARRDRTGERVRLSGEPPSPLSRPTGCAFHPRCPRAEAMCAADRPELLSVEACGAREAACHFRTERSPTVALSEMAGR